MKGVILLWLVRWSFALLEFPNPQRQWRMCGRPKASFVCDPEFILERDGAERLDQIAREFYKSTSCMCSQCGDAKGVSIAIFVSHNISKEATFKYPDGREVAEMLRRRWSLSTCGSDIVVVLLTQQNVSSFSMGPVVESIFSAEIAEQIIQGCRVHFLSGWYYQGLESILNSFNDVLVRLQKQQIDYSTTYKNLVVGVALGFAVLFIMAVVAVILLNRQRPSGKRSFSDIYENGRRKANQRKSSFDQEEHLEKLRKLNSSDDDDEIEDTSSYGRRALKRGEALPSVHFMRLNRQLSDVAEESSEDCEMTKRNSEHASFNSSHYSPTGIHHNIPVTEL